MTKEEFNALKRGDKILYNGQVYRVTVKEPKFKGIDIKGTPIPLEEVLLVPNQSNPNIFEKGN